MATPVQITVTVDSTGAVTGISQIGNAASTMGQQTSAAGLKGAEAVAALTKQWEAEQAVIAQVNARIKENIAAQEAQTAAIVKQSSMFQGLTNEQTKASVSGRLLEQTFGLQNRALNQIAARSSILGPLMASAFPLAIIAGVAPLLVKIGEEIVNTTNDWGGYTKAVQQVRAETVKASTDAFLNPKTIEFAQAHLNEVNKQIGVLAKAQNIETSRRDLAAEQTTLEGKITAFILSGTINSAASASLQAKEVELGEKRITLLERVGVLNKQITDEIARSQESTALIGKSGFAKIAQEHTNALADIQREFKVDPTDNPAVIGAKTERGKDARVAADNRATAEILELRRQEALETIKIQDQVTENALTGIAKIKQEEADHIKETLAEDVQKRGLSAAQVQQTERFQAQISKIHQDTTHKIRALELENAAAIAAIHDKTRDTFLQGDDLIFAQQEEAVTKARQEYEKAPSPAAWEKYQAEIVLADAEAQKKLRESHDATSQKDASILSRTKELQKVAAEDIKTAQEDAALAGVPEWQRASAQIQIELNRRERAIEDQKIRELAAEHITQDQIVAINQDADAKRLDAIVQSDIRIREENKRLTESLGSDLQSVFDDIASGNIGKRILANIEKLFFQIVAQWLLSLQVMKSAAGGILGSIVFGPGSTGAGVFGGGGGISAGTSILGSLFGSTVSRSTPISGPSGAAFQPGGIFSDPASFAAGSGIGSAIAGTGAAPGGGVLTSASNALTTSTVADALGGGSAATSSTSTTGKAGGLSSLFTGGNLASLGGLGLATIGSAFGGKTGQIGGLLTGLLLSGKLAPVLSSLFGTSLGLAGTGALVGGISGGLIGFGVGQAHGGILGSLAGAGSGALTGFLVGGPIGALVGGIVGLLGGIFGGIFGGSKRKKQANALADNTLLPDITQISTGFDGFQIDSSSAIQQLEQLRNDSQKQLSALQSQGKDVFNKKVAPAIDAAEAHIRDTQAERDRRSALQFGPPQFDTGGVFRVNGGTHGIAILQDGETVIKPGPSRNNKETLAAINAGARVGGGSTINLTVNALDAKSFDDWARRGGAQMLQNALDRHAIEGH